MSYAVQYGASIFAGFPPPHWLFVVIAAILVLFSLMLPKV